MSSEPSSVEALLDAGLQGLGLALDARARQRLIDYLALIGRWNRVYNLTAVRDRSAMVTQHLLDSLAVVPALRRHFAARTLGDGPGEDGADASGVRVLDVGSGAGLPGVVLAITEPGWSVTCVDAVAKKAGFLRQVAAELALPNLEAVHSRVEDLQSAPGFDLITSRAFASLADFIAGSRHLLRPSGAWVAMKGKMPRDELAALPPGARVFHVEPVTVPGLEAERCLVWMEKDR